MKKLKLLGQSFAAICALSTVVACSNSKPEERKEAPSTKGLDETRYVDPAKLAEKPAEATTPPEGSAAGSAAGSAGGSAAGSAAVTPAAGADLPKECQDYRAAVDKMNACEKFGATKTKLADTFKTSWESWSKLPADGKAKLAAECKASAASIESVGKAACGW